MKSIQEEIDKILSDNECCGEFGVWYEAVQKKVVKQLFQLFKTKWLEMLEDEEDSSDEKAFPEGGSDHSFVRNQLRQELRHQISKEEV